MSRELILIPKVRYESLIKNEQLKETKTIQDEEVQNGNNSQHENSLIKKEGNENIKEAEKRKLDSISANIETEKGMNVKRRKSVFQKGSGKSYVKMPPLEFSNEEKLTLKQKWLSFPI